MEENTEFTEFEDKEKYTTLKTVFEWIELFVISVTIVMVLLSCFMRYSPVSGASMNETLQDKDVLILSNLFYTPENGDIVVFESKVTGYDEPYVKRVIATEGQVVDIKTVGDRLEVTVDGVVPEYEQYATYKGVARSFYASDIVYPYTVPEGYVFCMGDNRWNSKDSRDIGPVDAREIVGHVVFRLFPMSSFGKVN